MLSVQEHDDRRWEGIDVSNAERAGSRASKPLAILKTYLKNPVVAFGLVQVTYMRGGDTMGKFVSLAEERITDASWHMGHLLVRTC